MIIMPNRVPMQPITRCHRKKNVYSESLDDRVGRAYMYAILISGLGALSIHAWITFSSWAFPS